MSWEDRRGGSTQPHHLRVTTGSNGRGEGGRCPIVLSEGGAERVDDTQGPGQNVGSPLRSWRQGPTKPRGPRNRTFPSGGSQHTALSLSLELPTQVGPESQVCPGDKGQGGRGGFEPAHSRPLPSPGQNSNITPATDGTSCDFSGADWHGASRGGRGPKAQVTVPPAPPALEEFRNLPRMLGTTSLRGQGSP